MFELCITVSIHASLKTEMALHSNIYFSLLQPPLVQAIFNGDPDEVRALIFKKEDVNFQVNSNISFEYNLLLF